MKYIYCCICGTKKSTRHQRYKKLLGQCNGDVQVLKKTYVCLDCRSSLKHTTNKHQCDIFKIDLYYQLCSEINSLVVQLHKIGIQTPAHRALFYNDMKKLLEAYFLREFIINVKDNRVASVLIKNIPFMGDHEIKIKEQQ